MSFAFCADQLTLLYYSISQISQEDLDEGYQLVQCSGCSLMLSIVLQFSANELVCIVTYCVFTKKAYFLLVASFLLMSNTTIPDTRLTYISDGKLFAVKLQTCTGISKFMKSRNCKYDIGVHCSDGACVYKITTTSFRVCTSHRTNSYLFQMLWHSLAHNTALSALLIWRNWIKLTIQIVAQLWAVALQRSAQSDEALLYSRETVGKGCGAFIPVQKLSIGLPFVSSTNIHVFDS